MWTDGTFILVQGQVLRWWKVPIENDIRLHALVNLDLNLHFTRREVGQPE
jgi:hypothetical protein